MLAAPMAGAGDTLLSQVLSMAVKRGLVRPKQHVVCVLSMRGDLVLNVCQVDDKGSGLQSNLASLGTPLTLNPIRWVRHAAACSAVSSVHWPAIVCCAMLCKAPNVATTAGWEPLVTCKIITALGVCRHGDAIAQDGLQVSCVFR